MGGSATWRLRIFANPLCLHQIYWIQIIVDAALLPIFYLILTETRGDVILEKRAKKMRKEGRTNAYAKSELEKVSLLQNIKISFMRPTKMLATEFVVIVSAIQNFLLPLVRFYQCNADPNSSTGIHSLGQLRMGNPLPLPKQRPDSLQSSLRLQHPTSRLGPTSTGRRRNPSQLRQSHSRQTIHAIRKTQHGASRQTNPRSKTVLRSTRLHNFLCRHVLVWMGIERKPTLDHPYAWIRMRGYWGIQHLSRRC